jgi:hypothetical protein
MAECERIRPFALANKALWQIGLKNVDQSPWEHLAATETFPSMPDFSVA